MARAFREHRLKTADGPSLYMRIYEGEDARATPMLCVPGLTRNCTDFEAMAQGLAPRVTLVTPDLRGRGRSDHDPDLRRYHPDTYVADMLAVMDELDLARVVMLGTSLGGLVTMLLAQRAPERLAAAVLNDVGPMLNPVGLTRVAASAASIGPVRSWADAVRAVRHINQIAFPAYGPAEWEAFARRIYMEGPDGRPVPAYDPRIMEALGVVGAGPSDLWPAFRALGAVPTLLIHGQISDVFVKDAIPMMQALHPRLSVQEVPRVGHAPMLIEPQALDALNAFLARHA